MSKNLRLSDSVINQIQVCVQMAMLSGTDIVDHFRMLRLVSDDGVLDLDPEYTKTFKENISKMMSEIESLEGDTELEG
jgi:hypothetical protein